MVQDYRTVVYDALYTSFCEGLRPFVLQTLQAYSANWWDECFVPIVNESTYKGKVSSATGNHEDVFMRVTDPYLLFKLITAKWLNSSKSRMPNRDLFQKKLSEFGIIYVEELMTVRNESVAHSASALSLEDALRAFDTMARLLELIGDNNRADKLRQVVNDLMRPALEITAVKKRRAVWAQPFPISPGDFVGRLIDLNNLASAMEEGRRGVVIWGSPGIGKSTLATKLAELLKPNYPDAQIYRDLKGGGSESPLSMRDIAAYVIQSVEPQDVLPDDESAIMGLYQRITFEKSRKEAGKEFKEPRRILLFMDNAANQAQIEALIPPDGSVMVVTSRQYFPLRGFDSLELFQLPRADAVKLLKKIVPRLTEAKADAIATLCEDYPFPLIQAGGRLASEIDLDPDEYIQQLQNEPVERVGLIEARLRGSYNAVSVDEQRLWRALAIFSGSFTAQAAAAVWNLDLATAKKHLTPLVKRSLIRYDSKRYQLHDLYREFIYQQMDSAEQADFGRRHAFYYLETAIADTMALYRGDDESEQRGVGQFEWDWPNYQSAWAWASQRATVDEEVRQLCYRYLDAGWHLIILRQPAKQWIESLVPALADAQRSGDTKAELRRTYRLATAYEAAQEYSHVVALYERALELARNLNSPALPVVLISLGKALIRDLGSVSDYVGNVVRSHYDRHFVDYGKVVWDLEDIPEKIIPDKSKSVWLDLLDGELFDFENIETGEIDVALLKQQSAIVYQQGERAITLFVEAAQIWHGLGNEWRELEALVQVAGTYASLGDLEAAVEKYQQARTLAQKVDPDSVGQITWKLGNCYARLGHYFFHAQELHKAVEYYEHAMVLFGDADESYVDTSVLCSLTLALIQLGNWGAAQDYQIRLENHLVHSERSGSRWRDLCDPYWEVGLAYARAGQKERAANSLKECFVFALFNRMPETREYLNRLTDAFLEISDLLKEVVDYCRKQLREEVWYRNEADYVFYDSLSWQIVLIYERMGEYEKAIADAEQCVEWDIEANRPEAGKHMAYLESLRVQWASQQRGKQ